MENCVYIISGPPAVGKSSVSNELAYTYDKSAVIEGDMIYLMIRSGLVAPWEDKGYYMDLLWDNIISITDNLIKRDITVIIEYVIFKEQIKKITHFPIWKTFKNSNINSILTYFIPFRIHSSVR